MLASEPYETLAEYGVSERRSPSYWATDHDWRACEARLNALPQFTTDIDGVDIHFVHVKSPHENALPLIMTHGCPALSWS